DLPRHLAVALQRDPRRRLRRAVEQLLPRALVGVAHPTAGRQLVLGAADVLPARRERARLQRRDGVVRTALLALAGARLPARHQLRAVDDGGGGDRDGGGLSAVAT